MKGNEAPERLYLSKNIYSTYLYQVPDPDDESAVEYTRTDALVEDVVKWLKDNADKYIEIKDGVLQLKKGLYKDLKNAMKL